MNLADFDGKRVLVTGARGFLGQNILRVLSKTKADVVALDWFTMTAQMKALPPQRYANVEYVDHDVRKPFPIWGPVDYILSMSGIASPVHYKRFPLETVDICVMGTRNMLDLAEAKGAKIVFTSSSEVYGDPSLVPTPETYIGAVDPHTDRSPYDVSKLLGETLCKCYRDRSVDVKIVRYFNVYGPGLSPNDYRVMSRYAGAIIRGESLRVFGEGDQTRTFCYVDDAIRGTLTVLLKGGLGPYNVGDPRSEITMLGLAREFESLRPGGPWEVEHATPPPEYVKEPRRRCPDIARLAELGYTPETPLLEGIARFIEWAREVYK